MEEKMKLKISVAISLMLFLSGAALAQYHGGSYDGYDLVASEQMSLDGPPALDKYYGGSYGGYDLAASEQMSLDGPPALDKYYGGSYDGFAMGTSASDISLPVELNTFSLSLNTDGVLLEWATASELNNLGFNILRSLIDSTGYAQINPVIIEGQGNSSSGGNYRYVDDAIQPEQTYFYKIEQVDISGVKTYFGPESIFVSTDVIEKFKIPDTYDLAQNYPNPFNPDTKIRFQLPQDEFVTIGIYDILGKQIRVLTNRHFDAGYHSIIWDGKDRDGNFVTSGIYFYRIEAGNFQDVKKMILLR